MSELTISAPVFVVGVPRSGTTLLRMMLNAHSQIALAPETHFFNQVCSSGDVYSNLNDTDEVTRRWDEYVKTKYGQDLNFDDVTISYIRDSATSYKELFELILNKYSESGNKNVCGEKTPSHLFYVPELLHWFPDARIIHIVRDPRSVCLSLAKVPWATVDVVSTSRVWNKYIHFGNVLKEKYPSSIIEVKYEDIVNEAKSTLVYICDFIGLSYEEKMLDFYRYSDKYVEKDEPWKDGVKSPLNPASLKKWKTELTGFQKYQILVKCRKCLAEKGYLPDGKIGLLGKMLSFIEVSFVNVLWALRRTIRRILNNSN